MTHVKLVYVRRGRGDDDTSCSPLVYDCVECFLFFSANTTEEFGEVDDKIILNFATGVTWFPSFIIIS